MPSLSDLSLNRQLYKTQPQTAETLSADAVASNLAPAPSTAIASGNSVTDINTNAETINGQQITPGTVALDIANWGWTQSCVFSSSDADTVAWTSGTFTSADGTTVYSIGASNTGNMVALTYVYLDIAVSTTAYQLTTNVNTPVGVGKVLIAVCQNGSATATFNTVQAHQIVGDNIIANTINATKITAGSITATQINASYVYAGTLNASQINAGTLTGIVIQTQSSGQRVVLTSTLAQFFNSSGTEIVDTYADSNSYLIKGIQSASSIVLDAGSSGSVVFRNNATSNAIINASGFAPSVSGGLDLGNISFKWNDLWLTGQQVYQGIDQPVVYFGYCSGTTISTTNAGSFTLTNPSTGKYTITHNFGTTNYTVVATTLKASGAGDHVCKIEARSSNTFQVTTFTANDGIVSASDFMFNVTKIS